MDHEDHPMTHAEWIREQERIEVHFQGQAHPERAWICSDRDVWYPNPHYNGPPVPHPESDIDES